MASAPSWIATAAAISSPSDGDVRQHDPDPIAGLDPAGAQQAGHVSGAALEGGVVQDDVVELDRGPVAVLGRGVDQQAREVGHAAIIR